MYCIDQTSDEPIMLINSHIGFDADTTDKDGNIILGDGVGIIGAQFQQELLYIDTLGKKRIQVWINSCGGNVMDGYSIYNAILASKTPVDTYCVGCAASIAGVIFQAGRKRIMSDYSWLMYHNPFGGSDAILSTMKDSIVKMIESRCGMSESEVNRMMNRETFILADEAKSMNLCDEVDQTSKLNTKYLKKITNSTQFYKEAKLVLNSIINNQNQNPMIKVCMKLGLVDGTPEESIVQAIDSIMNKAKLAESAKDAAILEAQNKAKADESEMDKLKAKFKKLEEEKAAKDAAYEDCKNALDAMEKDKKAAEDKACEEKAKNMVEGFAKAGRIKNEATVILKWSNLAKADFEGTKSMIEELPLNKVAVKIEGEVNQLKDGELPTTALGMAVRNKLKREGK